MGILSPNLVEVVELLFAIALSGGVAVMVNARYKTTELAYVIENADLKLLFTTNRIADYVNFADLLYESLSGLQEANDPLSLKLSSAPLLRGVVMMENPGQAGIAPFSDFLHFADETSADQAWTRRSRVALSEPSPTPWPSAHVRWRAARP